MAHRDREHAPPTPRMLPASLLDGGAHLCRSPRADATRAHRTGMDGLTRDHAIPSRCDCAIGARHNDVRHRAPAHDAAFRVAGGQFAANPRRKFPWFLRMLMSRTSVPLIDTLTGLS